MSKASRRTAITDALRDIRSAAGDLSKAERHIEERSAGIRAATYGAPTGGPAFAEGDEEGRYAIADPTGDAAITTDACRAADKRLDRAARALARAAAELNACVAQAIAVATPTPEELIELEAKAEPGCEVVGRIERPNGGPNHWEPVHTTTDYNGLLPRPFALGAWADMFVRRNGRLPTEHETMAHCAGRRVMVKA